MALYDDIGGAPPFRAALDAFYPRVLADEKLSPFFLGVDIERLKKTQEGFLRWRWAAPAPTRGEVCPTLMRGRGSAEPTTRCSIPSSRCSRACSSISAVPDAKIGEILPLFEGARGQVLKG